MPLMELHRLVPGVRPNLSNARIDKFIGEKGRNTFIIRARGVNPTPAYVR